MPRKCVIRSPISQRIGTFGLPRQVMVRLLARMHGDIPVDYERFKYLRHQADERTYRYRFVIREDATRHLFVFTIDDTTSLEHLIVTTIQYRVRPQQ